MGEDKNAIQTVAEKAKKAGKKVGVTTSVSVDHATPAAFYAHQPDRNMAMRLLLTCRKLILTFYAGGGFLKPTTSFDKKEAPSIFLSLKKLDIQWHVVTMTIKQNQLRLKK